MPAEDFPFRTDDPHEALIVDLRTWIRSGTMPAQEARAVAASWAPSMPTAERTALVERILAEERARVSTVARPTEAERAERALRSLWTQGIHYKPAGGFTQQEATFVAAEEGNRLGLEPAGVVSYSHQDMDGLVRGGGLNLRYGGMDPAAVGRAIQKALEDAGLPVEWGGNPAQTIKVPVRWVLPIPEDTTDLERLLWAMAAANGRPDYRVHLSVDEVWAQVVCHAFNAFYPFVEEPETLGAEIGLTGEVLSWEAGTFATWSLEGVHPGALPSVIERYFDQLGKSGEAPSIRLEFV